MGRRTSIPTGIEVRGASIRLTFTYRGIRCRETVKLPPTPRNIKYVERWRATILHEIATNQFDYAKHFPDSSHASRFRPGAATTVRQALESWLTGMQKASAFSTWQDYANMVRNHLIPEFGDYKLAEVTTALIKEWVGELECGPKRVNNLLIPLRGMFADAFGDGIIERDPMARIKNLKRTRVYKPDPFSPNEIRAILEHSEGQIRNFWQFAFGTGLRTGELIALQWNDIDWQKGVVQVLRSIVRGRERDGTKTESGIREVKLLPMVLAALVAQKNYTFHAGGTIFHNPRHNAPWTGPKALAKGPWAVVLRRAKVRYRNLYQTRHTYASILLTAGEDPMWVAQQMGHKDWGMIRKIYGRWIPEMRPDAGNRAAAALGQFWGKTETTQDDLGQTGATPDDDNPSDLAKKWRSGRDSNPRPPA